MPPPHPRDLGSDGGATAPRATDREVVGVDRRSWRVVRVSGGDAVSWCGDLLTADIVGLRAFGATRSLLLTPTGRIRADVTVYRRAADLLLVQDPTQPATIDDLLAPYVLSSDVVIERISVGPLCLFPGPAPTATEVWTPGQLSVPGDDRARGVDLLLGTDDPLPAGFVPVDASQAERWRVRMGIPRFGPDLDERSLPAEASLDRPELGVIDPSKGCFLGQESVAKIRNFGRPPSRVVAARAHGLVRPGTPITSDGREVGVVTSAVAPADGGGTAAIVRVARDADGARLAAGSEPLELEGS